jgi:hypothetical protein
MFQWLNDLIRTAFKPLVRDVPAEIYIFDEPLEDDAETYCLGLLTEESGEISQMVGKAFRFGLHTPGRKAPDGTVDMQITPFTELSRECGDMLAAIEFSTRHGIIHGDVVGEQYEKKLAKLLDLDAKDNLGRPLAPQPKD